MKIKPGELYFPIKNFAPLCQDNYLGFLIMFNLFSDTENETVIYHNPDIKYIKKGKLIIDVLSAKHTNVKELPIILQITINNKKYIRIIKKHEVYFRPVFNRIKIILKTKVIKPVIKITRLAKNKNDKLKGDWLFCGMNCEVV